MKAKDLPYPFVENNKKHIVLKDRLWAIPELEEKDPAFSFPGWNDSQFFGNVHPVHVEYCSGNGAWIASRAQQDPQINWLGIEMKFDRVRKIWSKTKNFNLQNLFVLYGEGLQATRHYFPDNSVDAVYVNFPDPWPKRRHAKNRIIEPIFVGEVLRTLKKGGVFTLVTDDEEYSKQMIEVVTANPGFESCFPAPFFVTHYEGYGSSYFESLWREKGKTIHFHQFKKNRDTAQ